ncbi:MAG: purine-binding chemotaxis protein CheW [Candidatus Omnitrophica bacterium]|nr:purine-binding chemotaxis protein CheW [Candidatus Omnitrophota bacterium]
MMEDTQNLTLYEDDFYGKNEAQEKLIQFVVFRAASEWYGVEITNVREVVNFEKITYLPSSPEHIAGIFSLRGNILSATDLKKIFGLPAQNLTEKSKLVIIKSGILETGILVDDVTEPLDVPADQIDPTLTTIAPERADYLSGTCHVGEKFIGILKAEKILQAKK